jgi:hypothetical protein
MLGLFAFFYASLHFATWFGLDKGFDMHEILGDFTKRRFIIAGLTATCAWCRWPSRPPKGWIRRLGGRRWQLLHRLVYVTGIAAVVHYYWLVKSDIRLPLLYGSLVAILLAYRAAMGYGRAVLPRSPEMLPLDHVTVAGDDLRRMQAALAAIGIATVYGGAHRDGATEMALVSFPDGSYLELIAPRRTSPLLWLKITPGPDSLPATPAPAPGRSRPAISIPNCAVCAPPAYRYRLLPPMAACGPMACASNGRPPLPAPARRAAFSPS